MDVQTRSDGGRMRKRKADDSGQDSHNERLSKRLGLLNLERGGERLYVPVETRPPNTFASSATDLDLVAEKENVKTTLPRASVQASTGACSSSPGSSTTMNDTEQDDIMRLDNTAHKVYIYNLDDEISSSDDSSPPSSPRMSMDKITFHPDLKAHLLSTRIPAQIRANSEGEFAGVNLHNELVLYNVPSSLSVPEEKDSVRKAIIETRARARDAQRREREAARTAPVDLSRFNNAVDHGGQMISARHAGKQMEEVAQKEEPQDMDAMDLD